jgi:hypothetical protein
MGFTRAKHCHSESMPSMRCCRAEASRSAPSMKSLSRGRTARALPCPLCSLLAFSRGYPRLADEAAVSQMSSSDRAFFVRSMMVAARYDEAGNNCHRDIVDRG